MEKSLSIFIVLAVTALLAGSFYVWQSPGTNRKFQLEAAGSDLSPFKEIFRAEILEVTSLNSWDGPRLSMIRQEITAQAKSGTVAGEKITVLAEDRLTDRGLQELRPGNGIVVGSIPNENGVEYVFLERYRLPGLAWLAAAFLALSLLFIKIKALKALAGLAVSLAVMIGFMVPSLLAGKNAILTTAITAGLVAVGSLFMAHGWNKKTALSVVSTLTVLGLAQAVAALVVWALKISGSGSDEAFFVQAGYFGQLNLQGLFLGSILIGTLGILDDVTTTQTATVAELKSANRSLKFFELYRSGSRVGAEHITSLINTLVLTYAGASLPLLLLFYVGQSQLWVILNSAPLAEEIVRTLIGSAALVAAVPVSTALAAFFYSDHQEKI